VKVEVVLPEQASGDLVKLTEYLTKKLFKGEWQGGGLLGGEYGYGVDYENDTFMMHHYCWCEEPGCEWCLGCSCEFESDDSWKVVKTCDNCKGDKERAPNFVYKPTNTKIWWYKWIGRSQEQEGELPKGYLKKCKDSVEVKS
jgi:hypothetical protein